MSEEDFRSGLRAGMAGACPDPREVDGMLGQAWAAWEGRSLGTRSEQIAFVEGPLADIITRSLPAPRAIGMLQAIMKVVTAAAQAAPPVHERVTGRLVVPRAPIVPVLVIAGSNTLAASLRSRLGSDRAVLHAARDAEGARAGLALDPFVVVVDTQHPADLTAAQCLALVDEGPSHAYWTVWSARTPLGRAIGDGLTARSVTHLLFDTEDGLHALVDVIVSRRSV